MEKVFESVEKIVETVENVENTKLSTFHNGLSCGNRDFPQAFLLAVPDIFDNIFDGFFIALVIAHIFLNLLDGVDNGAVIPPSKFFPYGGHGHLRNFPHNINGNLSGGGNLGIPFCGTDVRRGNAINTPYFIDNPVPMSTPRRTGW